MSLSAEFARLKSLVEQLIGLLEESEETFWILYLKRALPRLEGKELSGATYVLGCFSGTGSMSDLVLSAADPAAEDLAVRNLNARYARLRDETFASASRIASRELW